MGETKSFSHVRAIKLLKDAHPGRWRVEWHTGFRTVVVLDGDDGKTVITITAESIEARTDSTGHLVHVVVKLASGDELPIAINRLVELKWPEDRIERALAAQEKANDRAHEAERMARKAMLRERSNEEAQRLRARIIELERELERRPLLLEVRS